MLAAAVIVLGFASVALASAQTPITYQGTLGTYLPGPVSGNVNFCLRSSIIDVADNRATSYAFTADAVGRTCSGAVTVAAGSIGARAYGYRDGALCSTTSWAYNNSSAQWIAVGNVLCANPVGLQTFRTSAYGQINNLGTYLTYGPLASPNQSY